MKGSAPLRFLGALVGCWIGFRVFALWPGAADETGPVQPLLPPYAPMAGPLQQPVGPAGLPASASGPAAIRWARASQSAPAPGTRWIYLPRTVELPPAATSLANALPASATPLPQAATSAPRPVLGAISYPPLPIAAAPGSTPVPATRWSGSAWLLLREEAAPDGGLAPGGTLGGSQAGLRLAYRLNRDSRRPLALSGRLYLPVDRPQGAEAALGLDWKPFAGLPLHILAERRERLGSEGRSDMAVTVYGGGEKRLLRGRVRVEAYAQAGVVGLEEQDLFADGAIRAGAPVGPVEIGAGAWGGAQPGAARLDIGPQLSARLPIGRTGIRASAEWRFRVAGDAAPGSGPALTIGMDF